MAEFFLRERGTEGEGNQLKTKQLQIGKVFFGLEISNLLSQIVDQYAMNDIYTATLNLMPGFMFILIPCFNVAILILTLWLHVITRSKVRRLPSWLANI